MRIHEWKDKQVYKEYKIYEKLTQKDPKILIHEETRKKITSNQSSLLDYIKPK